MVQFGSVRDLARKELSDYLDKYAGTKIIIWDEGLTGPMDLIAKVKKNIIIHFQSLDDLIIITYTFDSVSVSIFQRKKCHSNVFNENQ